MAHDPSLTTAVPFKTGAVTVIQRFDSALVLNVHFHSIVLDGVYALDRRAQPTFHPTPPPTDAEVADVATAIYRKLYALVDDEGCGSEPASALAVCASASIMRVAATGARRGSPLRRIIGEKPPPARILGRRCAQIEGFNLHANTRVAANERDQLENLCRYLARPPLSDERLTSLPDGNLALRLKRPWSDGTTHLILSPPCRAPITGRIIGAPPAGPLQASTQATPSCAGVRARSSASGFRASTGRWFCSRFSWATTDF